LFFFFVVVVVVFLKGGVGVGNRTCLLYVVLLHTTRYMHYHTRNLCVAGSVHVAILGTLYFPYIWYFLTCD